MNNLNETLSGTWMELVRSIDAEVGNLPQAERQWIGDRLQKIGSLQERMHACFAGANGEQACRSCGGACCHRGKNHFTLVNLLGFLLRNNYPPMPEFTGTCPFLGEKGCTLDVARRPFNCISFLCEIIEEKLPSSTREAFYRHEAQLRAFYLEFDRRYAGSSLRGLFIRAQRMQGRLFLERLSEG